MLGNWRKRKQIKKKAEQERAAFEKVLKDGGYLRQVDIDNQVAVERQKRLWHSLPYKQKMAVLRRLAKEKENDGKK